jgi:hypothetical protein
MSTTEPPPTSSPTEPPANPPPGVTIASVTGPVTNSMVTIQTGDISLTLPLPPPALHQLPPPPADFTGREAELRELLEAVEQGGALISGLRGMGGVGNYVEYRDPLPTPQEGSRTHWGTKQQRDITKRSEPELKA